MNRRLKNKINLSALDKRILRRLQENIPFASRPWEIIAGELNINEGVFLKRVASLKKKGIIRRISAVFSPREIGLVSTLAAIKIVPDKTKDVVKKINAFSEVTHNYRRDTEEYNIWFTIVSTSKAGIKRILSLLKQDKAVEEISEFPAIKLFKINVCFEI